MEKKTNYSIQTLLESRSFLYVLLLIVTICFVSTYTKIYDVKLDMNGDNIHYYALGKALAEGKGFTNTISFSETPHTHFPPGYPVFVAGVMKFFPDNINAVKIANGILLYAAILLLFFLLKKISGSIIVAFLTCVFCSIHAEILRYATIMMSEMLFLFCSVAAIFLMLSIKPEQLFTKKGVRDTILLVLLLFLVNYIYFVRTMGTLLILAIIIYSGILFLKPCYALYKNRKALEESPSRKTSFQQLLRYGLLFVLLAGSFWGTKTAWDIRNKNVGKTSNDYISDFMKKPNGQTMANWDDWKNRITDNFGSYLNKWLPNAILNTPYNLNAKSSGGEIFRGMLIAFLIIFGLIKLPKGGLLLFLYLGATMAVLLVWPEQYGGLRYFIAAIPFFIFLFFYGINAVILYPGKRRRKNIPVFLPAACMIIFALIFMFPAYSQALVEKKQLAKYKTWSPEIAGNAFAEFTAAMQWCGKNLPDSARVICRKPEIFFMYSGGKKCGSFSQYGKPEDILQQLIGQKATHVIIDHWFRHAYYTLYPLISTHYPEKFKFVGKFESRGAQQEPPTLIFEFHPDWTKPETNAQ